MLPGEALFVLDLVATFAPFLIVSLSLNLEYGFGGVPNFGKVVAVAGGAFVVGFLPGRLLAAMMGIGQGQSYVDNSTQIISAINLQINQNVALSMGIFLLTLAVVILVGGFLGFITALPAARLRTDYLAMTLLAFGEVVLIIGSYYPPLIGGPPGVGVPDVFGCFSNYPILGLTGGEMRYLMATTFMVVIALAIFLYAQKLTGSPLGRMLRGVRDDENSALALGKDVTRTRIKIMIIAAAMAAIGGALFAFYTAYVNAGMYSRGTWTFLPWVMIILGGAANNWGALIGTFVLLTARKLIIYYKDFFAPFIPFDVIWLDLIIFGVALILILLYKPEGMIPEKPIKTIKYDYPPTASESKAQQPSTTNRKAGKSSESGSVWVDLKNKFTGTKKKSGQT